MYIIDVSVAYAPEPLFFDTVIPVPPLLILSWRTVLSLLWIRIPDSSSSRFFMYAMINMVLMDILAPGSASGTSGS